MVKIGEIFRKLTTRDFNILNSIEKGMSRYGYVPIEVIEKYSKIPEPHVILSLSKLHKLSLVKRRISVYKGYRLTYLGLDMLALKYLVDKGVLDAIGDKIGVGKESDIYQGLAPGNMLVAIKFLRIGRTSFKGIRRVRSYADDPRLDWYKQSKIAAEREIKALRELYYVGAPVPKPIGYNRHVVVIGYINGVELYTKPMLQDPYKVLIMIINTLRKAYIDVGIVHGDLSEYNVIVDIENSYPYIIDWPQYVYREHPSSDLLLKRDIEYIVRFFKKNYRVVIDIDRAIKYVRGEQESIE